MSTNFDFSCEDYRVYMRATMSLTGSALANDPCLTKILSKQGAVPLLMSQLISCASLSLVDNACDLAKGQLFRFFFIYKSMEGERIPPPDFHSSIGLSRPDKSENILFAQGAYMSEQMVVSQFR